MKTQTKEDFEWVRTHAIATSMEKNLLAPKADSSAKEDQGQRFDALDYLQDWARDPKQPAYGALLGEYGMGKTTTCKALTQALLARREEGDSTTPLPIYLDLRHLGDKAKQEPELATILATILKKSWQGGSLEPEVNAEMVVELVRKQGALIIFDGLDEVLVHLSPANGQAFIREIWRILPPPAKTKTKDSPKDNHGKHGADAQPTPDPKQADSQPTRLGKLLVSCRTHYFRTLRAQQNYFTGEDREPVAATRYAALLLLPFGDQQIAEYFRRNLPEQELERVLALIRSVHNLPELSKRPYTLKLIAEHIPQLEQLQASGTPVRGVTLYREMVQSWLERDDPKHQIIPGHKQALMEHFARELWRSGQRDWSVDDLEQWLMDFLADHPGIAAHYHGKDRELLKEDLRTATFLVRGGEDRFRFAHTSLQEYFLAAFLHLALVESRPEDWALPLPGNPGLPFRPDRRWGYRALRRNPPADTGPLPAPSQRIAAGLVPAYR